MAPYSYPNVRSLGSYSVVPEVFTSPFAATPNPGEPYHQMVWRRVKKGQVFYVWTARNTIGRMGWRLQGPYFLSEKKGRYFSTAAQPGFVMRINTHYPFEVGPILFYRRVVTWPPDVWRLAQTATISQGPNAGLHDALEEMGCKYAHMAMSPYPLERLFVVNMIKTESSSYDGGL